ncbi:sensor histidine kinase [Crocinitomix catalasitica]|uniref:sensor histidine kinase n=1 Tax=Crocinitomix catalasitica TaxID=184607 RepID=UPI00047F1DD3|nr:sensor histidine kinase [Crocinitomix catalasitica]
MKKNNFISLAARNALVYFILFLFGLGASGWFLISYSSREILDLTKNRLDHTTDMVQFRFDSYFESIIQDVNQLSNSPLLSRYMGDPTSENLSLLTAEYISVLKNKRDYFQIRLLSIQEYGNELIRVERNADRIFETPSNKLQNKGDRDYFMELIQLPADAIYLSKIDLNKEFGKLSFPYIPTVRIGKKLKGNQLKDFIILINVDLNKLFAEMRNSLPSTYQLMMVNQDGHYLIHPDSSAAFTFEFDKEPLFFDEFKINEDHFETSNSIEMNKASVYEIVELNYDRMNYQLFAVIKADKSIEFASFYAWRNSVIWVSITVAVLFLVIAFLYMRKQVAELKEITTQLTLFSGKKRPGKLAIERRDEIGALARGFEQMSNEIFESHQLIDQSRRKAEKADQEKTEFLENMSHEIRNPLQAIIGSIQILEQNQVGEHQKPFLNALKFSSAQLNSLVSDVLDFNKIKSNEIVLQPKWTDLFVFCNELINSSKYQAKLKKIDLKLEFSEDLLQKKHLFDPARLYQILNNLITNAIKFTEQSGTVSFELKSGQNNSVIFLIRDTGQGITADEINKIQDRNYTSNYTTGAGLGLAIVKDLLKLHHAELKISSEANIGSEFSFSLQLKSQSDDKQESNLSRGAIISDNLSLLIIEDDPVIRDWYAHIFTNSTVTFLNNPDEINSNLNLKYDYIISDLNFENGMLNLRESKDVFLNVLNENGRLIIISGNDFVSDFDWVSVLKKPVEKSQIVELFKPLSIYQKPNFKHIERDYDFNQAFTRNAIGIMIQSWEQDKLTLEDALNNLNADKFGKVQHRIITSFRRLDLTEFEELLRQLMVKIESKQIVKTEIDQLKNFFKFYISELKKYQAGL